MSGRPGSRATDFSRGPARLAGMDQYGPRIVCLGFLGKAFCKNRFFLAEFYYDKGPNFILLFEVFIVPDFKEADQTFGGSGTGRDFTIYGFCP